VPCSGGLAALPKRKGRFKNRPDLAGAAQAKTPGPPLFIEKPQKTENRFI
jgi:hypothetical protein